MNTKSAEGLGALVRSLASLGVGLGFSEVLSEGLGDLTATSASGAYNLGWTLDGSTFWADFGPTVSLVFLVDLIETFDCIRPPSAGATPRLRTCDAEIWDLLTATCHKPHLASIVLQRPNEDKRNRYQI